MTVHFSGCWEMAGMEGRGPDSRQRGLEPQGGAADVSNVLKDKLSLPMMSRGGLRGG